MEDKIDRQKLAEEIARYFAGYSFSRHELKECLGLVDVLIDGGYISHPAPGVVGEATVDATGIRCHLEALRNANKGSAITVWQDGGWKLWQTLDAKNAEAEDNWLCTIPFPDIEYSAVIASRGVMGNEELIERLNKSHEYVQQMVDAIPDLSILGACKSVMVKETIHMAIAALAKNTPPLGGKICEVCDAELKKVSK